MGIGELERRKRLFWLGVILLTAVFLRLWQIGEIPPGLTHDEADHGITAWSIVQGERAVYFTVGYGREPLFDYATAVVMSWLGPTYLAGRLTAVLFSILTLLFLYLWTQTAFDSVTALLAVAGMAVGFWAVMTGRQTLRSVTLGVFFMSSLWLAFVGLRRIREGKEDWLLFILSGILLGISFYTYIPARALWLVFPGMLFYLLLFDRDFFANAWESLCMIVPIASIVLLPLFLYLRANPTAEVRIDELSAPLTAVRQGDWTPLLHNAQASLRLFFIEGDSAWRYNIAGRPWLSWWMGLLFGVGLIIVTVWAIRPLWHKTEQTVWRGLASWTVLLWLLLGFAPVLITGPELSTTQAIGMQPVIYLLPALSLSVISYQLSVIRFQPSAFSLQPLILGVIILLFATTAFQTWRDLVRWGQHPEVRVQYESAMVTAMDYVNQSDETAVSISTITPGQFHTPALAAMMLTESAQPRWFNAAGGLLIPNEAESVLILPGFTPLADGLVPYFDTAKLQQTLPQPATDLDRPLSVYEVDLAEMQADWEEAFTAVSDETVLGDSLRLVGFDIQTEEPSVGQSLRVATLWQIEQPINAETRLFTQLLGDSGEPIGQQDRLDAPAESWQAGDWLIQLHQFDLTEEMVGKRPLFIGGYTCQDGCQIIIPMQFEIGGNLQNGPLYIGDIEVLP